MRTKRRLIPAIVVFVAAAGAAFAQQPKRQPSLPPLPKARATPVPQSPDTVPPTEQKSKTLVLVPIRTTPKKPAQPAASKKPTERPAAAESSSQVKESAPAASGVAAESPLSRSPGTAGAANVPAGTVSPVVSPTAQPTDKKPVEAAQGKTSVGSWIVLGIGGSL